jgi:hypothetical protein
MKETKEPSESWFKKIVKVKDTITNLDMDKLMTTVQNRLYSHTEEPMEI